MYISPILLISFQQSVHNIQCVFKLLLCQSAWWNRAWPQDRQRVFRQKGGGDADSHIKRVNMSLWRFYFFFNCVTCSQTSVGWELMTQEHHNVTTGQEEAIIVVVATMCFPLLSFERGILKRFSYLRNYLYCYPTYYYINKTIIKMCSICDFTAAVWYIVKSYIHTSYSTG